MPFYETRVFWFCCSMVCALMVFAGLNLPSAVWMLNAMIASANFGAKCVRAETRKDALRRSPT